MIKVYVTTLLGARTNKSSERSFRWYSLFATLLISHWQKVWLWKGNLFLPLFDVWDSMLKLKFKNGMQFIHPLWPLKIKIKILQLTWPCNRKKSVYTNIFLWHFSAPDSVLLCDRTVRCCLQVKRKDWMEDLYNWCE